MVIHDLKHPIESAIGQLVLLEKNVKHLGKQIKQNTLILEEISNQLKNITKVPNNKD